MTLQDNGREDQRPWDKFFWADLEADTGVRASSLAAQGLWTRMLCIMARSKKKGFLLDGENQMESKTLAKLVGESVETIDTLLAELKGHDVYSLTDNGTIYNRRMVRQAHLSEVRAEAGRLGGIQKKAKPKQKGSKKISARVRTSASASEYESIKNSWNTFAEKNKLPKVEGIVKDSVREKHLRARLQEKSFDFEALLKRISESSFLLGLKKDFKATFDWILCPTNYQKIMEGNYTDTRPIPQDGSRVGAHTEPDDHSPAYYRRAQDLRAQGLAGEALTDRLREEGFS